MCLWLCKHRPQDPHACSHSVGGLYVLGHAMQFSEAMAGTVLVDSSHPDQAKHKQLDPARNELKPVRYLAATALGAPTPVRHPADGRSATQ